MSTKSKVIKVIIYIFLVLLALIYLVPLIWVVITSLKDDAVLMISPWALPDRPMFENYEFAWTMGNLGKATLNSFIVCSITLVLSMLFGSMAAYAIAILRLEIIKAYHDLFSDWYDDPGALRIDSAVYPVIQNRTQ